MASANSDDKSLQQCPKSVQPDYTITFCPAPAPSFEEQIAALGGRTDAPKQPATPPASQNAEQPAKQPVEPPTTPAAAQPAAGQPQKRASLLATNVCVPVSTPRSKMRRLLIAIDMISAWLYSSFRRWRCQTTRGMHRKRRRSESTYRWEE